MASLVVFALDPPCLAAFYQAVTGYSIDHSDTGGFRLRGESADIFLHAIPEEIAASIAVTTPPVSREDAAIKPVFDVPSLSNALAAVTEFGGVVTDRSFEYAGAVLHDVLDTEGNVLQLRWWQK